MVGLKIILLIICVVIIVNNHNREFFTDIQNESGGGGKLKKKTPKSKKRTTCLNKCSSTYECITANIDYLKYNDKDYRIVAKTKGGPLGDPPDSYTIEIGDGKQIVTKKDNIILPKICSNDCCISNVMSAVPSAGISALIYFIIAVVIGLFSYCWYWYSEATGDQDTQHSGGSGTHSVDYSDDSD